MAYINGNKPIVTDGLIYALDFGNTRSYTSGSTTAASMAYDRVTTSVSGSPVLTDGLLDFTGTEFIKRDSALSTLSSDGTFTVMVVGKPLQEGTLLHQDTLNTTINPSSSLFGFELDAGTLSRSYPGFTSSSLQHVTYRYSQGTVDTFINGIPITASAANSALTTTAVSNALFLGSGSAGFSGSLAQFYVYNRSLSVDEIYETYLVSAERNGLPTIPKPYTQDENLYKYLQTTGITDATTISAVNTFISDLKSNGIWDKMTVIYPFLTTATGSQAVNLKDPGVLAVDYSGSYTASSTGPVPATATDYIDLTGIKPTYAYPGINSGSSHFTALSYDPQSQVGFLGGTSLRAAGGDLIVSSGSRVYHVYLTTGTSSFTMTDSSITNVEVLVVGGGGQGGTNRGGGGGGAGGLVYSSSFSITPNTSLPVIVGNGGRNNNVYGHTGEAAENGENSVFESIVAVGGGGGGAGYNNTSNTRAYGQDGGSGGGAGNPRLYTGYTPSGSGTPGQGNNGGFTTGSNGIDKMGGGGGGAGSPGIPGSDSGVFPSGTGGSGSYFSQYAGIGYGSPIGWFAGGGGGGKYGGVVAPGGIGGGGGGSNEGKNAVNGTGGGGAAPRGAPEYQLGGYGGSGIVIVSYDAPATALTGSGTGLYITEDAITGSVNNGFTAGITGSGTIGFLTVSRTGSNSYSLRKNNQQATINLAASASIGTDFFLGGANLAGGPNLNLPAAISYASVGAGLTDSEVSTYYNLVSEFQTNLKRQNTLLDNYSGAAAAYSLRRIGPSGYFGPAIRVRRDSDNALRDIGFTSDGQLDTVGLLDFVGVTGSGFVDTWYDQSGNGYNVGQPTTTRQPSVVLSGSIPLQNKKPFLYFDGTSDYLGGSNYFNPGNYLNAVNFLISTGSVFTVSRMRSNATSQTAWWMVYDSHLGSFAILETTQTQRRGPGYVELGRTGGNLGSSTNLTIASDIFQTSNTLKFVNNTQYSGSASSFSYGTGKTFFIGAQWGGGSYIRGGAMNLSELILHNVDQSSNRNGIESNINTNYKIYGDATASFDPDYQAFITATGITEPTQSAALETLVSDLKSYGLWSKMKAVYPMVTDKNNRFSRSEDFSTTWTKVSSSVTVDSTTAPDGTSTADLILEEAGAGEHYFYETVNNLVSGNEYVLSIYGKFLNRPWIALQTNEGAQAWFDLQNGVTGSFTGSSVSITDAGSGWYRCALFFTGSTDGARNQHIHLADADGNYSYTGVADSGSYLWGAQFENGNLLGPYRKTEGSSFTTASMFDQIKYNLVNPVDSDAGFRLTYSGSWNPGYSGVKPDGTTAYADTKVKPSENFTNNNTHLGFYSRTNNSTAGNLIEMGSQTNGLTNLYELKVKEGTSFIVSSYSYVTANRVVATNSNSQGFYIGSRISSTSLKGYKNNNLVATNTTPNTTTDITTNTNSIYLSALNAGGPFYYSDRETGFASIGDGLTDYQAKALYWIVQKFQTTLGRQVY